jgi:BlaI family transcriptional regulator, penicillinase repressor
MASRRPKPTAAELEILGVLWRRGPSTVHDVHPELARGSRVGYTTVLKTLQIMFEKGLVSRNGTSRPHVFKAAVPEDGVKRRLVSEFLEQVFDGSAMGLVMQALSAKGATKDEVRQLRQLLDEIEGERS